MSAQGSPASWIVIACSVALAAALAWLLALTMPMPRAIRVRNAFLIRRGERSDFSWTPEVVPAGFRVETAKLPPEIAEAIAGAGLERVPGDWDRALALCAFILRDVGEGAPIRADLVTTWRGIRAGAGYCADYVRVFLACASALGLFCRQWAVSFDGFGGHGHTFVEVYDRQQRAWRFLDPHNNVYACSRANGALLDVDGLRRALGEDPVGVVFERAGPARLGFAIPEKLVAYYRRGANGWYLYWGNDVIARESQGAARFLARVSAPIAHRIGGVLGRIPLLVVPVTRENETALARMETLRSRVRLALLACCALAALLLVAWIGRASGGAHG